MARTRKVLVAVPERLLGQIDLLAEFRSQTRSELIRDALRNHVDRSQTAPVSVTTPTLSLVTSAAQNRDQPGLSIAAN